MGNDLKDALASGDAQEFKRCVNELGVWTTALTVGHILSDATQGIDVLLRSGCHLFDPQVLAGTSDGENFLHFILHYLTVATLRTTNDRKLAILQAMGPHLRGRDLKGLDLTRLGPDGVRYIASIISDLPDLFLWMEAALFFEDRLLVAEFVPRLSAPDRCWLWRNVPVHDSMKQVDLMHAYVPPPDTEDQQREVFQKMICLEDDQAEVMESLLRAWPLAAANFQIQPSSKSWHYFWRGKTLRLLLEAGASLDRETWITVFRWEAPSVLVEQIHELSLSTDQLIDWHLPNAVGIQFLEEVYVKLNDTDPAERFPILQKLLALQLDPGPLLLPHLQDKLSPDEKALLAANAALPKARRDVLADPSSPSSAMVVDLDLA